MPGWYQIDNSCFKFDYGNVYMDQENSTLNTARKKCFETGSNLAIPRTQSLLTSLWNISAARQGPHLLGAYDSFRLDLKWSNGGRVNSAVWGPREPNPNLGRCAVMGNYFTPDWCDWWLATTSCYGLTGFICETSPGTLFISSVYESHSDIV